MHLHLTIPFRPDRQGGIASLGDCLHWHGVALENADPTAATPKRFLGLPQARAALLVMGAYTYSSLRQAFLGG